MQIKKHRKMQLYTKATLKTWTIITIDEDTKKTGTLMHCWWEYEMVQPHWKLLLAVSRNVKHRFTLQPVIPLLSFYTRELKTLHPHKNLYTNAHSNIIHNS
jgi:hypothetical protein